MSLDPNIPLQVRSPQINIPSPFEQAGQVMQLRHLAQQGQMQDLQISQAQQDQQDQQTYKQAWMEAGGDPIKTRAIALQKGVGPKLITSIDKEITSAAEARAKLDGTKLDNLEKTNNALNALMQPVLPLGADPAKQEAVWNNQLQVAVQNKLLTPEQAAEHPYRGPDEVKRYAASLVTDKWMTAAARQKRAEIAADKNERDANLFPSLLTEAHNKAVTTAPNANGLTPDQQRQADAQAAELKRRGMPSTPTELAVYAADPSRTPEEKATAMAALKTLEDHAKASRPVTSVSVRGSGQDAGVLNDDDYKRMGQEYAITGVMPPLGNGSAAVKQKIIHAKNEFARTSGLTPREMAVASAAFKGDSKALATLQSQRDQVVAFEQTAQKNLDMFVDLAKKIPDTGVPWLNTPLRLLDEKLAGSANMAAVNAARQVANNEIAKVTSGGGLGGVLSDTARKEVSEYNPRNATLKQTLKVAETLRNDMAARHASLDNTLNMQRDRIGTFGGAGGSGAPAAQPVATHRFNPATGKIEEVK